MDASPEELISKLEDMVECSICLQQFEDPRSLPCHHSFCRNCLEGVLGPERKIRCPCCNKEALVHNGVQELPVDFRANSWLEIMSEYQKAKEAREAEAAEAAVTTQAAFELMSGDQPCPICEQITTDSKALSCGHCLCGNCVQFLLPVGGDTLHCPTCCTETVILPTPNTQPTTSTLRSQPDNPSANVPLYQTLFELLGGRPPTAAGGRSQRAQPSAPPGMVCDRSHPTFPSARDENTSAESRLTFHARCGHNADVLPDQVTAYRKNPMVWGEALVLTSQHLERNQMFEVRLDKKAGKWSGSLQIGVTTHSPVEPDFPSAFHQLRSGTWYMAGRRVRHNSLTVIEEYGQDLDKLEVGDRVGVQRTADGCLHFYINGVDLGVAASFVPSAVYGIINIFGKAEQVTIINNYVDTASTPTPPSASPTPRSLYPDLTAVSATSQQAVEGMSMPQMLSMLELLTTAVTKSQEGNLPESPNMQPCPPGLPLSPSIHKPPPPQVASQPSPVCPPRSSQSEQQQHPPPVPTTPRPSTLNRQRPQARQRPQERPPSPPTTPRPNLLTLSPQGPPPLSPSPGSSCPSQVSDRGPLPPPPSRTRPVFPPSTNDLEIYASIDETPTPAPSLLRSTSSAPGQPQVDTQTGNRRSQDMSACVSSDGPQQRHRVSLAALLNKKSSLKKTAKK